MSKLKIFTDGGARGNPGPAAAAFVVFSNEKMVKKEGQYLGETTNNKAEYLAVKMALEWLLENRRDTEKVDFFLDSELVVKQLTGVYKIKNQELASIAIAIKKLEREVSADFSYTHVRRENNHEADAMVNETLDLHLKNS